eukprot:TRINITY_DN3081_c0_g2_i1.p1 TRINITY_DN3081_c0_g2~~TRINITY_DN3081_c0_g2_i1.p1  ORF type:complete len:640 (+),score=179.61 TRINITY_DN3081_c0_g2_i1:43-1920(+)
MPDLPVATTPPPSPPPQSPSPPSPPPPPPPHSSPPVDTPLTEWLPQLSLTGDASAYCVALAQDGYVTVDHLLSDDFLSSKDLVTNGLNKRDARYLLRILWELQSSKSNVAKGFQVANSFTSSFAYFPPAYEAPPSAPNANPFFVSPLFTPDSTFTGLYDAALRETARASQRVEEELELKLELMNEEGEMLPPVSPTLKRRRERGESEESLSLPSKRRKKALSSEAQYLLNDRLKRAREAKKVKKAKELSLSEEKSARGTIISVTEACRFVFQDLPNGTELHQNDIGELVKKRGLMTENDTSMSVVKRIYAAIAKNTNKGSESWFVKTRPATWMLRSGLPRFEEPSPTRLRLTREYYANIQAQTKRRKSLKAKSQKVRTRTRGQEDSDLESLGEGERFSSEAVGRDAMDVDEVEVSGREETGGEIDLEKETDPGVEEKETEEKEEKEGGLEKGVEGGGEEETKEKEETEAKVEEKEAETAEKPLDTVEASNPNLIPSTSPSPPVHLEVEDSVPVVEIAAAPNSNHVGGEEVNATSVGEPAVLKEPVPPVERAELAVEREDVMMGVDEGALDESGEAVSNADPSPSPSPVVTPSPAVVEPAGSTAVAEQSALSAAQLLVGVSESPRG